MGGISEVRIIAIVQGESSATVSTVHPQTIDSASGTQTFSDYLTVELGADNLDDGVLTDEVLIYDPSLEATLLQMVRSMMLQPGTPQHVVALTAV